MAAGPLLVVEYEDVVPGESAKVEGIQRTKDPKEGQAQEGEQEDMNSSIETAAALLLSLDLRFFLNLGKSVPVHPQLHVEALPLVLAPLDGAGDGEEAGSRLELPHEAGPLHRSLVLVANGHRYSQPANRLLSPQAFSVHYLNSFLVRINPEIEV